MSDPAPSFLALSSAVETGNDRIIDALGAVRESFDAAVYKLKEPSIFEKLREAIERGVRARLVVDVTEFEDQDKKKDEKKRYFRVLQREGAEIRTCKADEKLHAKFAIVDRSLVLTGSYNWTKRADKKKELLMDFDDERNVERFESLFASLWAEGVRPSDRRS